MCLKFKKSIGCWANIFLLLVIITPMVSIADVAPRGGATDQAQALIQQLGAERARLSAENSKLKKKLKEVEGELEELKSASEKTDKKLNVVQSQLNQKTNLSEKLNGKLEEAKNKMQELITKFRETITNLRQVENESAQRAQEIARLDRELKLCATNNVALSELGYEVLAKYEDKGFWDRVGQKEPFTKIKKVQIENLVDDYKYKIEDQEYSLPKESEKISRN